MRLDIQVKSEQDKMCAERGNSAVFQRHHLFGCMSLTLSISIENEGQSGMSLIKTRLEKIV